MKVLIIKKVDDPSAIILEVVDMPVADGAVNFHGRVTYGHHEAVALGAVRDETLVFNHAIRGSRELRDWLLELMPLRSAKADLDDIKQHVISPMIPKVGDTVTVIQADGIAGAGEPQVVIALGYGFDILFDRRNGSSHVASMKADAEVTLGRRGPKGVTMAQNVPA